ncbi:SRPBCC domain-containing protein [Kribbella solani]|uniref:SRPBCC family protein n=1 Tax=Kribbella solani TaxID=236067 RepID=UPI0029BB74B0|nr:SRPBCC domain-containing protein [Kribbella solani]MDX3004503.1 SRPBCC domain-containing protein [Kribbella solani]
MTSKIVVTVAAPVDVVWDALRDKEKIRHWHGWEYEGAEGGLDEEIDQIYFTHVVEDGTTLRLGNGDVFAVEPVEGGARITLTRAPLGADPDWDAYYDDVTEGWITFLHQLRFAVERHPDEPRHTLFYSGTAPIARLGIPNQPAGTTYELELFRQELKGEVWYTTDHQTGLTVDAWGNGLLIVSHIPPGVQKPDGASMAILSSYGDIDRDDLDARWQSGWAQLG